MSERPAIWIARKHLAKVAGLSPGQYVLLHQRTYIVTEIDVRSFGDIPVELLQGQRTEEVTPLDITRFVE